MVVTGYALRNAIRRWQLRRDTAAAQFSGSLTKFEGEDKQTPDAVATEFLNAEKAIARLQAAQNEYNGRVKIVVPGMDNMTICTAVKLVGGAARLEKMWRAVVAPIRERWETSNVSLGTRNKTEERAAWTMSTKDMADRTAKAAALTGALRSGIAEGNSIKIDIEGLDGTLLAE
jgi:hypothetical protein